MPSASGYCILTSVEGVQNLVQYSELTSCLQCQSVCVPFELKGAKCNRRVDMSNTFLYNSLKQTENCKRLIDQDSLKSYLKEKECIRRESLGM